MKFASPEFLYALFAIAIPILIHLFNFRKFKKIYFSNVEFLKEVQQETQAKSKLKHLLILLSRILAIIFLVLAFAQPFIPSSANDISNQSNLVGIYIDNSFSMESKGENGSLLNTAKLKAIDLVHSYRPTDKFILSTNNFKTGSQHTLSNEEVIDKIEAVTISTSSRQLSKIYSRNREAINSSEIKNKSFYIFSDFQASTTDFENFQSDSIISSYLIPIQGAAVNNLYIDSCWFDAPTHLIHQNEVLNIRIQNNSDNNLENIPVQLFLNNQNIVPANFSVKANDFKLVTLNYSNKTTGVQQGKVMLRDQPITMDDAFYFTYTISENINILGIGNDEPALHSIYHTDSIFNYSNFMPNQLDYSKIKTSNLLVLHHLKTVTSGLATSIQSFVNQGGSLLVFPADEIDTESYREFLSLLNVNYYTAIDTLPAKVGTINLTHPIYKNVFDGIPKGNLNMPMVTAHYKVSKGTTAYQNKLLSLKNGAPFLTEYQVGKGTVYLSTVSLTKASSNLTNHALFVPTLYNIALFSQATYPLFHTIGSNSSIEVNRTPAKDPVYHIKNKTMDLIPKVKNTNNKTTIFVNSGIETANNYFLENATSKVGLAYNYNRSESELNSLTPSAIASAIELSGIHAQLIDVANGTIQSAMSALNIGKKYWKYCIILALFFLGVEIVLLKIFK
jgi:hypothetical protein